METEWELLELSGPLDNFIVHEISGIMLYAIGTVIIL